MTPWTEERVAKLRVLWPDYSAMRIAMKLKGFDDYRDRGRSAVLAKASRLGLTPKTQPKGAIANRPTRTPTPPRAIGE